MPDEHRVKEIALSKSKPDSTAAAPSRSVPRPDKDDWDNPAVPAGDAPPRARWPLVVAAVAWGAWVVFLVAMMIVRIRTTPV